MSELAACKLSVCSREKTSQGKNDYLQEKNDFSEEKWLSAGEKWLAQGKKMTSCGRKMTLSREKYDYLREKMTVSGGKNDILGLVYVRIVMIRNIPNVSFETYQRQNCLKLMWQFLYVTISGCPQTVTRQCK